MFRIKRSNKLKQIETTPTDRMASVIAGTIKRMQEQFVKLLTALFQKLGTRMSKIVFVVVLTATGLYSLYLTGIAFLQPTKSIQLFRPASIQQPENIQQDYSKTVMALIALDTITTEKLRSFLTYFDSIKTNQPTQYDSILQSRPGLIDSVRMLTQLYYSQQKHEAYEK
ncbi:hypothetical protein [Lacibacter sp.]|uniref:hypothetical protein n=1 Tax=Lacibacter sp. TaxID=1915409 RepID=UPI002B4AB528|nr:hypothetical protein [Lacibacter sp.]HLP36995.1 hypothetical protein [Lacibacter sp.]